MTSVFWSTLLLVATGATSAAAGKKLIYDISFLEYLATGCYKRYGCNSLQQGCQTLTLNGPGGGICPQAGSSLCCAKTVSSRKLKLCDFYYILIGLNSEYKPVPWDIQCCHGSATVKGCSVKFWLKSVENCNFLLKSFSNFNLCLLFVISISKLPPVPNFKQIG